MLIHKMGQIGILVLCGVIGYRSLAPRHVDARSLSAVGGQCCTTTTPTSCGKNGNGACNTNVDRCDFKGLLVCSTMHGVDGSEPCIADIDHCYNIMNEQTCTDPPPK